MSSVAVTEAGGERDLTAEQTSGRAAARLADGSGFLITDGPGAGSVTDENTGPDVRDAPPLPGRDKAHAGTLPLFTVQRPSKFFKPVLRLLAQARTSKLNGLNLPVAVPSSEARRQPSPEYS
jgi:hypothetical protein